ncbi:hypothetical protein FOZ62_018614, partial [Perkinsus olseni]
SNTSKSGTQVTMYCCACGSPAARRRRDADVPEGPKGQKILLHYLNTSSEVKVFSAGDHDHGWKKNPGVLPPFDKLVEEHVEKGVTTWDEMERIIDNYMELHRIPAAEKPQKTK